MPADDEFQLTVGSLVGLPLGAVRSPAVATSTARPESTVDEIEGPNWTVTAGQISRGRQSAWHSGEVEALTFNNPFGQVMERVWFEGKVVFAVDLGAVTVDPEQVKVAQEYQVVYSVELDEHGRHMGQPGWRSHRRLGQPRAARADRPRAGRLPRARRLGSGEGYSGRAPLA